MRGEAILSNQRQEKIRVFAVNPSLMDDNDETIVAKLCRNKMLIGSYGVWDVCDYIACTNVENSPIISNHQQLIIHFMILLAVQQQVGNFEAKPTLKKVLALKVNLVCLHIYTWHNFLNCKRLALFVYCIEVFVIGTHLDHRMLNCDFLTKGNSRTIEGLSIGLQCYYTASHQEVGKGVGLIEVGEGEMGDVVLVVENSADIILMIQFHHINRAHNEAHPLLIHLNLLHSLVQDVQ